MAIKILDGVGQGTKAKVLSDNRLAVNSAQQHLAVTAAENGNAYVVASGLISLTTTGVYHPLLYFQSSADIHLHIRRVVFNIDYEKVTTAAWFNPSGGTIVANEVAAVALNTNLSSGKQFPGLVYSGVDGDTITGGLGPVPIRYANAPLPIESVEIFVLGRGNSVALGVNPTVAVTVGITAILYFSD